MDGLPSVARHTGAANMAGAYLIGFVLVFAPLFRGGNRPLPLLVLEIAALVMGILIVAQPRFVEHLSRFQIGALAGLLLLPLAQLVPVPFEVWGALPGREYYAQALATLLSPESPTTVRGISLIASATEAAWLALLVPVTVFLVSIGLTARQLHALLGLFLGIVTFEAVLGLVQYGEGADGLFRLGNTYMIDSAFGTYVNRNHLAGLLEMALPVAIALLASTVGYRDRQHRHRPSLRQRLGALASLRANRAVLYGVVALATLLGLVFTRSRTGVLLAMLGILLSILAFSRRLGGKNVFGVVGTLTFVGAMLALEIGLAPVLERFVLQDPANDSRWSIFDSTLRGIGEFFPLGSGMGTFPEAYPRFQPVDLSGFVNHAHNDYLEWLMEGGLWAGALLVAFIGFYLRQWPRVWSPGIWVAFRFAQVGAGIGLFLMILHGFVDFNLHIPANGVFFAFLAAVFFHRYREEKPLRYHPNKENRADQPRPAPRPESPPLANTPNPFAE